jgi:probable phosphoglycerate mutase
VTDILLIRHAMCDPVGVAIAGRAAGIHLNAAGREQARELGEWLALLRLDAIYSGPLERAYETACIVAAPHALAVRVSSGLDELDFGEWTGRTLAELEPLPAWRRFNERRSEAPVPGGERMVDAQRRAVAELDRLAREHPRGRVAAVSHGDILRAVLVYHLRMSLDDIHRLEVSPASVSVVTLDGGPPRVRRVNIPANAGTLSADA